MSDDLMYFVESDIMITIEGMGIVFCSERVASSYEQDYDVFNNEFSRPEQVAKHVLKGDITGFCTGSGGTYTLHFRDGYPDTSVKEIYDTMARLGIEIRGGTMNIYDLFELMEWNNNCPNDRKLRIEDGFYHITLCTCRPTSGIIGDNQEIYVYLNRLDSMPILKYSGVPQLIPPTKSSDNS